MDPHPFWSVINLLLSVGLDNEKGDNLHQGFLVKLKITTWLCGGMRIINDLMSTHNRVSTFVLFSNKVIYKKDNVYKNARTTTIKTI